MGEIIAFKPNGRTANGYLTMPAADAGPGLATLAWDRTITVLNNALV